MRVTDPEALGVWRKLKKIIFSTVFVIVAIPIIGAGAFVVSGEIKAILASFGIFFHYHIPDIVHRADVMAVITTVLILIAFSVVVALKDVIESFLPEKHAEAATQHSDKREDARIQVPELANNNYANLDTQAGKDGPSSSKEAEQGTVAQAVPVKGTRRPNKNLSRRRRKRQNRTQRNRTRRKRG